MKKHLNENGFSLVGVMIALAVVSLAAVAVISSIKNVTDLQAATKFGNQAVNFHEELWSQLSSEAACLNTFAAVAVGAAKTVSINAIKDDNGANKFTVNQNTIFGDNSVLINQMNFAVPALAASTTIAQGTFTVVYQPLVQGVGTGVKQRSVTVVFNRKGPAITGCIAKPKMTPGVWGVAANANDAFYSTGNVGMDTNAPRTTLDVKGAVVNAPGKLNTTANVDFSTGNFQYTNASCGLFNMINMKDGGTYTFVVRGGTAASCTFKAFSDAGATAIQNVLYPNGYGFTTAGAPTAFNLRVVGSYLYVGWNK